MSRTEGDLRAIVQAGAWRELDFLGRSKVRLAQEYLDLLDAPFTRTSDAQADTLEEALDGIEVMELRGWTNADALRFSALDREASEKELARLLAEARKHGRGNDG